MAEALYLCPLSLIQPTSVNGLTKLEFRLFQLTIDLPQNLNTLKVLMTAGKRTTGSLIMHKK